jgi:hypothetical protein
MLGVPATALALASGPSQPAGGSLTATVSARRVAYERAVVLSGQAPAADAGQPVALELQPSGERRWRQVGSSRVKSDGSFRLKTSLRRSGALRAVGRWGQQPTHAAAVAPDASSASASSDAAYSSSAPQRVWVQARLNVPRQAINSLGQPVSVKGRLLPGQGGRHVELQELRAGRWYTVTTARTSKRGDFNLRYSPGGNTEHRLRVKFAGDGANTATSTLAGSVTVYQPSTASWYDDGGATACGFHAYYGVANLSLPCGTKVRFYAGGHAVTAVVDDRGPYVGGRQWDLNQNLAGALGFGGVGTVWTAQ